MSGFKVNFSVNNQLSTPSIHAAPFAQRPAAGQPGRVFIDSDNPSTGIYRDTGTTWVAIGNPSSPDVDTLQIVTGRGNTTTNSITVGAATTPSGTVDVRRSTAALNGTNDWAFIGVNTPTIPSGASFGVNYVNAVYGSQAQTFAGNATIGNTGLNSAGNFINTLGNSASGTITVAQGSGTIRAIAGLHAGIYYNTPNAMTFTHVAGIRTLQPINSGAVGASVTNYYGIHVADSTPSSGTISYTNRWGIYQEGASDLNYFAGNTGISTTNPVTTTGYRQLTINSPQSGPSYGSALDLQLNQSTRFRFQCDSTSVTINSTTQYPIYFDGNGSTKMTLFGNTGNLAIGTTVDSGYRVDLANGTLRVLDGGANSIRIQQSVGGVMGMTFRLVNTEYGNISVDTGGGSMTMSSPYQVVILSNSIAVARFSTNGNVSINTTTNNVHKLEVAGTIGNSVAFRNYVIGTGNSATAATYSFYGNTNNGYYSPSTDNQAWTTAGLERMRLDASGNFGINTAAPAARLHVNGTLRIDGQSSGTAGGSSGQHLIINLDGTTYKIALLNP